MRILILLSRFLAAAIVDDILVDHIDPAGTVHYSLADVYPNGMYSAVFRAVFIDEKGLAKDAVVKYALAEYDASCVSGIGDKIPCTSIHEELCALRTLACSPHVVRLLGTTADPPIAQETTADYPMTRFIGNFHVVLPGLVLERLSDTVHSHVASGIFWRRISAGFDDVAYQLQCLHVQIFAIVAELVGNFHMYNSDPSMSNILLTEEVWQDERRPFVCAKLKMIDYGLVASAVTNDAKLAGLALTLSKLDEHADSVRHIPGLALMADDDEEPCEPFRTIREFAENFYDDDSTYRVGPDDVAVKEITDFVRKLPPNDPTHALAVCGELAEWSESWCGTLTAAIHSSRFPISV
jgi:hypothetical protein